MGICANTSCGKAYMESQALKALNAEGYYTPDQIQKVCASNWNHQNPE